MQRRINVALRQDTYSKLRNEGMFGESFSALISRLLDELDKNGLLKGDRLQSG
jgi:predicted CopG family antitoxin